MSKYILTGTRKGNYNTGNPLTTSNLFEIGDTYITTTTTGGTGGETYYAGTGLNLNSGTFSVKYGTTTGTAAEGNDTRINNGQTAYNWGNHASAGYLTSLPAHTHNYENPLTFASTGSATVSRTGDTITIGATDTNTTYSAGSGLTLSSTTFSVNYGTSAGTAAQGNDSRINNGQTAYGWGNHASAGYLTSLPAHNHDSSYDNYLNWNLKTEGVQRESITTNKALDLRGGTNVTLSYASPGIVTINATPGGGGGETYTAGTGLTLTGTEFSVDYGTAAGTAAQGNDSRINNGQTAYGWGNHSTQGYLTSLPAHNHDGSYEKPLTFNSSGSASVSRVGDTITISATDTNTTYSNMSLAELNTGTVTSARSISAKTLTDWGVGKFAPISHSHSYENPLTFNSSGSASVSRVGNTITISATDTNTNTTYSAGTGLTLSSTTFSVNYGTSAGTAAQGNDSRINNGQTAYGWGNHASQGYLTSLPAHNHDGSYDNYNGWDLLVNGAGTNRITTGENVNFIAGSNVTLSMSGTNVTINATDTNTNTTYSAGSGLTLSSTTFSHADTSSQGSVNNSSSTVIQDITLDTYGHVTSIGSYNLNNVFVPKSGGTFTGAITATMFTQSLRKYKENIKPYEGNALQIIENTDIVTYDRKDKTVMNQIGIIADDAAKEYLNDDRNAVDIYKTIFLQNKAIQELNQKINNQQTQIDELKELVNKLLDR
jgi:uncharacterized metal-binding protein